LRRKIEKYGPFMTYNKERMKLILRGMVWQKIYLY
jgi:hypothetical protein